MPAPQMLKVQDQIDKEEQKQPNPFGDIVTEKDGLKESETFHNMSKSKHIPNTSYYKILRYKHAETRRIRRIMECQYPGCNKQFRKRCNFFDHLRIHTNEKPFICPVEGCSKGFSQSANLTKHLELHMGQRKFQCNTCHKKFFSLSSLHVIS